MLTLKECRVSYFKDLVDNRRVLTIVRKFDPKEGKVLFGFAVNKPDEWQVAHISKARVVFKKEKGDNFSKKEGKRLALAMLNKHPIMLEVAYGKRPEGLF